MPEAAFGGSRWPSIPGARQSCWSPATRAERASGRSTNGSSKRRMSAFASASPADCSRDAEAKAERQVEMAKTLRDVIAGLPAAERAEIEARAAVLIKEEMSLQDLRKAMRKTQIRVARKMKVGQDSVSRVEKARGHA